MPVSLSVRKLARNVLGIMLLLSFCSVIHAGLSVSEEEIRAARKKEADAKKTASRARADMLEMTESYRKAQAKADAVKKEMDKVKAAVGGSEDGLTKAQAKVSAAKTKLDAAKTKVPRIEGELEALKKKLKEAKKGAKRAEKGASLRQVDPNRLLGLNRADGFLRHHPGSFPQVAKQEVQDEKADAEAEKAAKEAAEKAAKEKAKADAAAKKAADKAAKAKAKAEAKANAEPGWFRKRALKSGKAQPETPGEKKWLDEYNAAQKAEADAAAKKEADKAAAKAKAEADEIAAAKAKADAKAKAEADKIAAAKAKEEAKIKAAAEKAAKEEADAKAKAEAAANAEPGWTRKRALKSGKAEPETPGEKKWLDAYMAGLKKEEADKIAAAKAKVEAEKAAKAKKDAERAAREEAERKRKEMAAQRKAEEKAKKEAEKAAKAKAEADAEAAKEAEKAAKAEAKRKAEEKAKADEAAAKAAAAALLAKLGKDIPQIEKQIKAKEMELITAQRELKEAKTAQREADKELEDVLSGVKGDRRSLPGLEAKYNDLQSKADATKAKLDAATKTAADQEAEARKQAALADSLVKKLETGQRMMKNALEIFDYYDTFAQKFDGLQSKIDFHSQEAKYYKDRIPAAKQAVIDATKEVSEAREAYDLHRIKLAEDTANVALIRSQVVVIETEKIARPKSEKSELDSELDPLRLAIKAAVDRMRKVEQEAVKIYRLADYNAYMADFTKRELERYRTSYDRAKTDYDKAIMALKPYGSIDEIDIEKRKAMQAKEAKKNKKKEEKKEEAPEKK